MKFVPHSYQREATERILKTPFSALFLDMGLGKTVSTLTAVSELLDTLETIRVLVIAPLHVAEDTWSRETEKWDHLKHLRVSKILGTADERKAALEADADIYTINFENIDWLIRQYAKVSKNKKGKETVVVRKGNWFPFDMVVIDEFSGFKNPKAIRFRRLRQIRPYIDRLVGLTGTPAPNGLIDLWAPMYLLDQGDRLGKTLGSYRRNFFQPGKRNGDIVYEWKIVKGMQERIYEKIDDICVSMKAEDYLTLPGLTRNIVTVKMSKSERKLYEKLKEDMLLEFADGDVIAENAATLTGKLMQLANGLVYNEHREVQPIHSRKLDALDSILSEANGKPVLLFYSFRHDLERILDRFPEAVKLKGSKEIADWNAGKVPLLVAHPASAGHGLNLQDGGNVMVWYGLTYSLEQYMQATARLYRQGQKERVISHHIVCEDTIDGAILAALKNKQIGQDQLMDALKAQF